MHTGFVRLVFAQIFGEYQEKFEGLPRLKKNVGRFEKCCIRAIPEPGGINYFGLMGTQLVMQQRYLWRFEVQTRVMVAICEHIFL